VSFLGRFVQFHREIECKGESLRGVADWNACGIVPALDARKLLADPRFAANLKKLKAAFRHLKIAGAKEAARSPLE